MRVDICRWRLAEQFLTTRGPQRGADVVRELGAVQAQDYAGAKWAVGQRTRGATHTKIEREIDTGQILRTHVLRPTWHFVAADDIRWMLELTAPRVTAMMAPANRRLELDRPVFLRTNAVFVRALEGGRSLTRAELAQQLERARIPIGTGQRLGHMMMQAELDGIVVSGPRRGKQFTYALLDERVPATPSSTREESMVELSRRYFRTRGPATPNDFAWWSGLTVADAKRAIELNGDALTRVTIGDRPYWLRADDIRPPRIAGTTHLLPNYDEYFIGYRDRSAIAERLRDASTVMGGNALIPHVIVSGGQLAGIWKRAVDKGSVVVTLAPLTKLTAAEISRVTAAARRFGAFLELPIVVRRE
jgi:hypothetical protein